MRLLKCEDFFFFFKLKANKNNQQERCQLNHSAVMHNMKVLSMVLPFM